jgi:hypothetical protein
MISPAAIPDAEPVRDKRTQVQPDIPQAWRSIAMTLRYMQVMFTPDVAKTQTRWGSRQRFARLSEGEAPDDELTPRETDFIAARDSFYLATVSETGWPYVQHRGGPKGFLQVLSASRLRFPDFAGNRQYISTGNVHGNARVALFLMDYAARQRLKIIGHAHVSDAPDAVARLSDIDSRARVERAVSIDIAAYDWNCSRHIVPRFSELEIPDRLAAGESGELDSSHSS